MLYFTTKDTRKATIAKGSRTSTSNSNTSSGCSKEGSDIDLYKVNSAFNNSMKRHVNSDRK